MLSNTKINSYSTKRKKFQLQQQYHLTHNQQGQFVKLLVNNNSNSLNLANTLPSNSNNTNNNLFMSPTMSVKSNRRLSHDISIIKRIKYRLDIYLQYRHVVKFKLKKSKTYFIMATSLPNLLSFYLLKFSVYSVTVSRVKDVPI